MNSTTERYERWLRSLQRIREDNRIYRKLGKIKKRLIAERGHKCQQCGRVPNTLDAHHILEIRQGGTNASNNILLLCEPCHQLEHCRRKRVRQ